MDVLIATKGVQISSSDIEYAKKEQKTLKKSMGRLTQQFQKLCDENKAISLELQKTQQDLEKVREENSVLVKDNTLMKQHNKKLRENSKNLLRDLVNVEQTHCKDQAEIVGLREENVRLKQECCKCKQKTEDLQDDIRIHADKSERRITQLTQDYEELAHKYEETLNEVSALAFAQEEAASQRRENADLKTKIDDLLRYKIHHKERETLSEPTCKHLDVEEQLNNALIKCKSYEERITSLQDDLNQATSLMQKLRNTSDEDSTKLQIAVQENGLLNKQYYILKKQFETCIAAVDSLRVTQVGFEEEIEQLKMETEKLTRGNLDKLNIIVKMSNVIKDFRKNVESET